MRKYCGGDEEFSHQISLVHNFDITHPLSPIDAFTCSLYCNLSATKCVGIGVVGSEILLSMAAAGGGHGLMDVVHVLCDAVLCCVGFWLLEISKHNRY
jgi:hypothetical protein